MIYIKSDTNSIQIPRHSNENPEELRLVLINNLTQQEVEVEVREFFLWSFTYQVEINPFTTVDGEYSYTLYNEENKELEIGLAVFGEYKNEVKSYGETTKKIQYNR